MLGPGKILGARIGATYDTLTISRADNTAAQDIGTDWFFGPTPEQKSASESNSLAITDGGTVQVFTQPNISIVTSTESGAADTQGTNCTIPVPAGTATGDIVVLMIEMWWDSTTIPTVTWPTGFVGNEFISYVSTTNGWQKFKCAWKRLSAPESISNYSVDWDISQWNMGHSILFRNAKASGNPIEVIDTQTSATGTNVANTSVNTAFKGILIHAVINENSATQTAQATGFTSLRQGAYLKTNYRIPFTAGLHQANGATVSASTVTLAALFNVISEETATNTPVSASESNSLAVSESASLSINNLASESNSLAVTESVDLVKTIPTTDGGSISVSDVSALTKYIDVLDSVSIAASDIATMSKTIDVSESIGLSVAESSQVTKQIDVSDSIALSISENVDKQIDFPGSDSSSVSLDDQSSIVISGTIINSAVDTVSLSALDLSQISSSSDRTDTASIAVSDVASIVVYQSSTDTFSLAVQEDSSSFNTLIGTDQINLVVNDESDAVKFAAISSSDTLGIGVSDAAFVHTMEITLKIFHEEMWKNAAIKVYVNGEWREGRIRRYMDGVWS